jgi:hypothetical protein
MKQMICAVVCAVLSISVLSSPALAVDVYLKEGGVIKAVSVWRSVGRIQVLINRDTLVEFLPQEIDTKRTFVKRHRPVTRKPVPVPEKTAATATAPPDKGSPQKKGGASLPSLPALPTRLPEKDPSALQGKDEGAIRKHKKEMGERLGE